MPPLRQARRAALRPAADGAIAHLVAAHQPTRLTPTMLHPCRPEDDVDGEPGQEEPQGVPHAAAHDQAKADQARQHEDQPGHGIEGEHVEARFGRLQLRAPPFGIRHVEAGGDKGARPVPAAEGQEGQRQVEDGGFAQHDIAIAQRRQHIARLRRQHHRDARQHDHRKRRPHRAQQRHPGHRPRRGRRHWRGWRSRLRRNLGLFWLLCHRNLRYRRSWSSGP